MAGMNHPTLDSSSAILHFHAFAMRRCSGNRSSEKMSPKSFFIIVVWIYCINNRKVQNFKKNNLCSSYVSIVVVWGSVTIDILRRDYLCQSWSHLSNLNGERIFYSFFFLRINLNFQCNSMFNVNILIRYHITELQFIRFSVLISTILWYYIWSNFPMKIVCTRDSIAK